MKVVFRCGKCSFQTSSAPPYRCLPLVVVVKGVCSLSNSLQALALLGHPWSQIVVLSVSQPVVASCMVMVGLWFAFGLAAGGWTVGLVAGGWTVGLAAGGWMVSLAAGWWTVSLAAGGWMVSLAAGGWMVGLAAAGWTVRLTAGGWTVGLAAEGWGVRYLGTHAGQHLIEKSVNIAIWISRVGLAAGRCLSPNFRDFLLCLFHQWVCIIASPDRFNQHIKLWRRNIVNVKVCNRHLTA